jgi:hypothetical protein
LEGLENLGTIWGQLRFLCIPQMALPDLSVTPKLLIFHLEKPSHGGSLSTQDVIANIGAAAQSAMDAFADCDE